MSGHHPEHIGLQGHSVGDAYPLAIVGYGSGDITMYVIENLVTGEVAQHDPDDRYSQIGPRQWAYLPYANAYLAGLVLKGKRLTHWRVARPVFKGSRLVWPDFAEPVHRRVLLQAAPRPVIPQREPTPREAYYAAFEQDIG